MRPLAGYPSASTANSTPIPISQATASFSYTPGQSGSIINPNNIPVSPPGRPSVVHAPPPQRPPYNTGGVGGVGNTTTPSISSPSSYQSASSFQANRSLPQAPTQSPPPQPQQSFYHGSTSVAVSAPQSMAPSRPSVAMPSSPPARQPPRQAPTSPSSARTSVVGQLPGGAPAQTNDLSARLAQLQREFAQERSERLRLEQELIHVSSQLDQAHEDIAILQGHVSALSLAKEESDRTAMIERKQRLEYQATVDRLSGGSQAYLNNPGRSGAAPPPPARPARRPDPSTHQSPQHASAAPVQQYAHHVSSPEASTTALPSPPHQPAAPAKVAIPSNGWDFDDDDDIPGPPPTQPPPPQQQQSSYGLHQRNTPDKPHNVGFSPLPASLVNNPKIDHKLAISPLDDEWSFDTLSPGTFMSRSAMDSLIQRTLDAWDSEFHFTKDVRDFILLEISDIVETASSEPMVHSNLERYHHAWAHSAYSLVRKVGSGGFGSVYQGIEKLTNMPVAIKVISLEDTDDDVVVITREITALVQGHTCPQLIKYYGSDVRLTKLWIVMEYIDGGSLLDHIKVEPLHERYVAVVAREVLLGLQYLNNEGKIHRDIKAANILISTDGGVKLADFGASRALNDTMTKCNTFVGSPYWMAPEVISQRDYDGKADLWSLGITCIELASGRPPHTHINPMAVLQLIIKEPPPQLVGTQFSKDFKEFVALCLQKDPSQRPSIQDLLKTKFIKGAKKTKIISELFGGEEH